MIDNVIDVIRYALNKAYENKVLKQQIDSNFNSFVKRSKNKKDGDYISSIALKNASIQRIAPKKIAEILIKFIKTDKFDVSISGPGFIVFKKKQ